MIALKYNIIIVTLTFKLSTDSKDLYHRYKVSVTKLQTIDDLHTLAPVHTSTMKSSKKSKKGWTDRFKSKKSAKWFNNRVISVAGKELPFPPADSHDIQVI